MKILNSRVHGALDYLAVIFLWSAPIIFNLNECVSLLSYLLGGIHLVLTADHSPKDAQQNRAYRFNSSYHYAIIYR
jgi:hypothetical protein